MFVQLSWEHGINKLCSLTWNGNRWIPYYMIGSGIKHDWNQKQPPFGLGTRWGLHIYPKGTSASEPWEPLKYVTGRSFSFLFLTSFIMSRIPSQINESTIWYDSCKNYYRTNIIWKKKYKIMRDKKITITKEKER